MSWSKSGVLSTAAARPLGTGQCECEKRIDGGDQNILPAIKHVCHGSVCDELVDIGMPKSLAGGGRHGQKVAGGVTGEYNVARCRQQPGNQIARSFIAQ